MVLVVDGGPTDGRTIILRKPVISMGRLPDSDLVVNEPTVSRRHAEIRRTDTGYYLADLNTHNGTYVNGRNIGIEPCLLKEGDRISLARTEIAFIYHVDSSRTIHLTQPDQSAPLIGFVEGLPQQGGTTRERLDALQANFRQLEDAHLQATNYAQDGRLPALLAEETIDILPQKHA